MRGSVNKIPKEYQTIVRKAVGFLADLERHEKTLQHLNKDQALQYFLSVMLYETNEFLQSMHDCAEDRAIRGQILTDDEIQFFHDITQCYNDMLGLVQASTDLAESNNLVITLSTAEDFSKTKKPDSHLSSDHDVKMSEHEVTQFCDKYVRRSGEKVLKSGVVVKTKGTTRSLRYLFLTNYQIMIAEEVTKLKRAYDLPVIQKGNNQ